MMNMKTMLQDTLDMLHDTDLPRRIIAAESGLGLEWLHKLAQGRIPDPGIIRIQRLHDYLSSRKKRRRRVA